MNRQETLNQIYKSLVDFAHDKLFYDGSTSKEFNHQIATNQYVIYLHFPFCKSSCKWCVYRKTVNLEQMDKYCELLIKEIEMWAQNQSLDGKYASAMFFGGGTPTLIPVKHLEKILNTIKKNFPFHEKSQITMEANPSSVTPELLDAYKDLGITRISIGGQSFQPAVLNEMNRKVTPEQVENTIKMVRDRGFEFNVDLLLGYDCQTTSMVLADVQKCMDLGASHISTNILTRQDKTDLGKKDKKQEMQEEMYFAARNLLRGAGYDQYSSEEYYKTTPCYYLKGVWSIPPMNLISFGAGSFGWVGEQNYFKKNLQPYMEAVQKNEFPLTYYKLTQEEDIAYRFFVGLRTTKVDRKVFKNTFGIDPVQLPFTSSLETSGMVTVDADFIRLTDSGVFDYGVLWSMLYFIDVIDALKQNF